MSKELILDAAVALAQHVGFRKVTRRAVAKKAKVAPGTVSYHFKSMGNLQDAIMRRAISASLLSVVAQGLLDGHRIARRAPQSLKDAAAKQLSA